jgi:hypothetical protein
MPNVRAVVTSSVHRHDRKMGSIVCADARSAPARRRARQKTPPLGSERRRIGRLLK